jgi:hypothetical protein
MHWNAARKIKGTVNRAVKAMKVKIARFNQRFGKMRIYRQRMLYFIRSISTPQKMVAI